MKQWQVMGGPHDGLVAPNEESVGQLRNRLKSCMDADDRTECYRHFVSLRRNGPGWMIRVGQCWEDGFQREVWTAMLDPIEGG